jgi:hypothetical protein
LTFGPQFHMGGGLEPLLTFDYDNRDSAASASNMTTNSVTVNLEDPKPSVL